MVGQMRLAAVSMFRNEADTCVPVIEHLLSEGVDHVTVADNLSVDGTRELLDSLAAKHWGKITIIDDLVEGYVQSQKMSALAKRAYDEGADFILPFDADEVFSAADPSLTIREALADCNAEIVQVYGYDYIARRDDDEAEPNPFRRIRWRREHPQSLPKVAFRSSPRALLHPGNHRVERDGRQVDGVLRLSHFQYRSLEHMTQKVRQGKAALEAAGLHRHHGTHWRRLGGMSDEDLAAEWGWASSWCGWCFLHSSSSSSSGLSCSQSSSP